MLLIKCFNLLKFKQQNLPVCSIVRFMLLVYFYGTKKKESIAVANCKHLFRHAQGNSIYFNFLLDGLTQIGKGCLKKDFGSAFFDFPGSGCISGLQIQQENLVETICFSVVSHHITGIGPNYSALRPGIIAGPDSQSPGRSGFNICYEYAIVCHI